MTKEGSGAFDECNSGLPKRRLGEYAFANSVISASIWRGKTHKHQTLYAELMECKKNPIEILLIFNVCTINSTCRTEPNSEIEPTGTLDRGERRPNAPRRDNHKKRGGEEKEDPSEREGRVQSRVMGGSAKDVRRLNWILTWPSEEISSP